MRAAPGVVKFDQSRIASRHDLGEARTACVAMNSEFDGMSQSFAEALSWVPVSHTLGSTLTRAHDYARSQAHRTVTLEHVLLALVEDGDAILVLQASSIDGGRLMSDVSAVLGRSEDRFGPGQPVEPAADEALIRILDYAAAAARQSRRREINGAIVLAAIVGEGRSVAASLLQSQGLTFEGAIKALQRSQSPPAESPTGAQPPRRPAHAAAPTAAAKPESPINNAASQANEQILSRVRRRIDETRTAPPAAPVAAVREPYPQPPAAAAPPPRAAVVAPPDRIAPAAKATLQEYSAAQQIPPSLSTAVPPAPSITVPSSAEPIAPAVRDIAAVPASPAIAAEPHAPSAAALAGEAADGLPSTFALPPVDRGAPPSGSGPALAKDLSRLPPPLPPIMPKPVEQTAPNEPEQIRQRPRPGAPFAHAGSAGSVQWPEAVRPQPQALPNSGLPRPQARPVPPPQPGGYPLDGGIAGPPYLEPDLAARPPSLPTPNLPVVRHRDTQVVAPRARVPIQAGQLVENIPRSMRVGRTETVEVRIAKANLKALADGLEGNTSVFAHVIVVTKAMSVRLRAPDGTFTIEGASPETQWIENALDQPGDDFASWRWHITPKKRGNARIQLVVSARTVGSDGFAAETTLPHQVIDVIVHTDFARLSKRVAGWAIAAFIGGVIARFGQGSVDTLLILWRGFE